MYILLNLQVTVQKIRFRISDSEYQIHRLKFNLTNTIIHLRSLMDRFKIFLCVPVYGDSPSLEYAIMNIPPNFLPDKNYQLSTVAF
jgi:hypothetical protein